MIAYIFILSKGIYEIKKAKKYPTQPVIRCFKESNSSKSLWILCIKKLEIITNKRGIKRGGDNNNLLTELSFFLKNPLFLKKDISLSINY